MFFRTLILLGAIMGHSIALPDNDTLMERDTPGDRCGDSLFYDETSIASPSIYDCAAIIYQLRINQPNQDVFVNLPAADANPVTLFTYGNCIFGVKQSYSEPGDQRAVIGTNDIADLIDTSIHMFGKGDKIGSKGAMVCSGKEGVWWGVFHTPS